MIYKKSISFYLFLGGEVYMAEIKENYEVMFTKYPDIVNIEQMRKMLGGISPTLAYKIVKQKKIKCKKVGREYKIPKVNIISYMINEQ